MAHTKSGGSTKLGRDSAAKRLGVKRQNGEAVNAGEILIRQRGTKYLPGLNVKRAGDDTLYALKPGTVKFMSKNKIRFDGSKRQVKVVTIEPIATR
ncbi:50S ribosomal protein L27 [Candidatus Wolfebacteria bacterium]|nr:50S ribosomal protein L27 [Candidatus Wolfebacteria bacterium]